MKILIILPDFYPKQTPRVFRWQALAEHWAAKGWDVDVLCASHRSWPEKDFFRGVRIYRIGQASMLDFVYNLLKRKNLRREVQKIEPSVEKKQRIIVSSLATFFHWVWKSIYWPDGACLWILPARNMALELTKANGYDAVISVSLPFSSHLVGLHVKRFFPKMTWIVDIGDPFSTLNDFPKNNLFFYKKLNQIEEYKVLKNADAISLTTLGAAVDYQTNFPSQIRKIKIIPPLYSNSKIEHPQFPSQLLQGRINIGYFGSFYTGIRQPEPMLELIVQLIGYQPTISKELAVHVFGYREPEFKKTFQEFEKMLVGCIFLHGQIEKNAVKQLMKECDFLVNVGNKTACQLPSKSVDYMMTGKPIINICQRPDDTFKQFFEGYPLILNLIFENGKFSPMQIDVLLDFIANQKGKTVDEGWLKIKIEEYGVKAIADQYERLMVVG